MSVPGKEGMLGGSSGVLESHARLREPTPKDLRPPPMRLRHAARARRLLQTSRDVVWSGRGERVPINVSQADCAGSHPMASGGATMASDTALGSARHRGGLPVITAPFEGVDAVPPVPGPSSPTRL